MFSLILCSPSILISLLMDDVQQIFKYFNSFLGFFLLFLIPIYIIWRFRIKLKDSGLIEGNINKTSLKSNLWFLLFIIIGIGMFVVIILGVLKKNTKICVAEEDEFGNDIMKLIYHFIK